MRLCLRWSALVFFLFVTLPAAAAEENDFSSPLGWTFRWIHFVIVFGLIAFLLVKKAPPFFRGRREAIAAAIAESSRGLAEGERRKQAASERLAGLDRELGELRSSARGDAAAEAERIRAGARDEVSKIDRAAQAEIAAASRATRSELKALTARLAVTRARQQIEKEITPVSEGQIFRAFIQQLNLGRATGSRN